MKANIQSLRTTGPYIGATYLSMLIGALGFLIGLWNAGMPLSEKGYYFTLLMFGLFGAVSLQKCVRDKLEGIQVSSTYVGICYIATGISLVLLAVGLWNAAMQPAEKGFYAMAFVLALFAAVTVQKNVRDGKAFDKLNGYGDYPSDQPVE
jgi:uncharacterized membrane protein YiaA